MKAFFAACVLLFSVTAQAAPTSVSFAEPVHLPVGSIWIRTQERALYLLVEPSRALRYPVAVPKRGKDWNGETRVEGKQWMPAWSPPADVRRDNPHLPNVIPGGATNNPMGVAAILLQREEIAIHGTAASMRSSIGSAASYGCIRMLNEDVTDLFARVQVGALVIKLP